MVKIRYPDSPEERDRLRDTMRRQGHGSVDEIAAAFRERWAYSHLRSYRVVLDLSQERVCAEVNKLLGVHAGDDGYFEHSTLSKIERWPYSGRRPTISQLVALATVYGTTPRRLIAPSDIDRYPPADQLALTTLDHGMAPAGPTTHPDNTGMMDIPGPQAQVPVHTSRTPWERPELGPGDPTERLIIMTGDESAQRHDHPTQVGEATIDQLRAETAQLARKFPNAPRLELFNGIRLLRDRVFHYLDGRLRTNEHRDLYFLAGAACGMLVTASDDLGYPGPAMSHARAALMFAKEAGSDTLTAWIYSAMANVCYWNHQHSKACDYARQGQRLNPTGSIAVLLPAIEARAIGQLGDEPASRAALNRVTAARESVRHGDLDDLGGIMSFSHAKQDYYAATAYFGIGSDPEVVSAADRAVAGYEVGPAEERAYDNMAIVQFHAAVAHVRSGDVDAAADYARPALSITPDHRNALVDKSAILLHDSLRAPRIRTSQVAIDTRDQVEDFLSVSAGGLELS